MNSAAVPVSAQTSSPDISCITSLTQYSEGLLTPLLAVVAIYIAYQQFRTNKERLRLELYSRRYDVFLGARALIATVFRRARASDEDLAAFDQATAQAVFLFGSEVDSYVNEIRDQLLGLLAIQDELKDQCDDDRKGQLLGERREIRAWFRSQLDLSVAKFRPYLQIGA